jgi:CRISPR system Cascade subunit CasD
LNTLFLRLEGPLQSWGDRGRWQERDTNGEPTKSGIVGLLACALGLGRNRDADIRSLSDSLQLGIRVDRPGLRLRDYHTVVGGVLSAGGRIKVNQQTKQPETVVSNRVYLSDASFLGAVMGPVSTVSRLSEALLSPHWPLFLGRKSCVSSAPIFAGTGDFPSLETALASQPLRGSGDTWPVRAIVETGEGAMRRDNIEILSARTYRPRFVKEMMLKPEVSPT